MQMNYQLFQNKYKNVVHRGYFFYDFIYQYDNLSLHKMYFINLAFQVSILPLLLVGL